LNNLIGVLGFLGNKKIQPSTEVVTFLSSSPNLMQTLISQFINPTFSPPKFEIKVNSLSSFLGKILNEEIDSDFIIEISNHKFKVHKFILEKCWPLFKGIFMKSPNNYHKHETDMPIKTFKKLLQILYFQETELNINDAKFILDYVEYYLLTDDIKVLCHKIFSTSINSNNWFDMFKMGVKLNSDEIKNLSLKFKPSNLDIELLEMIEQILVDNKKQSLEIQNLSSDNSQLKMELSIIYQRLEKIEKK